MKKIILILSIITTCISACGQEVNINTIDKSGENIYKWITTLSEGDINWDSAYRGVSYRAIITNSEIYNDIYIEKITVGEEGGGRIIQWKRMVSREELTTKFKIKGEFTGVEFIKWTTWNSFELKIQNKKYLFKNIESPKLQVSELK